MCDLDASLPPLAEDEYVLDTTIVRALVAAVQARAAAAATPADACAAVAPLFERLLADGDWLPERFQEPVPGSGMGGGIGQWLLYRAADRSLCLFSLVVPPGSMTPIHDHLAWGLVGVYRGAQDEEFYVPRTDGIAPGRRRPLVAGDFYALLPPVDDVHRVRTTSDVTSVSIHLLANDTGCVSRHSYDPDTGEARPFRSGYANADCATRD